jgi:hypothetical protein
MLVQRYHLADGVTGRLSVLPRFIHQSRDHGQQLARPQAQIHEASVTDAALPDYAHYQPVRGN